MYIHIRIIYSWIPWKIYVNRNNICQIKIFKNRNNIHEMTLWRIGIGIYLWHKYQRIYSWWIYLQTICEIFAKRELFAEHWIVQYRIYSSIVPMIKSNSRNVKWPVVIGLSMHGYNYTIKNCTNEEFESPFINS